MNDDDLIRAIHARTRTIAVVGLSPKAHRASHAVAAFLQRQGFRIIPVNPVHASQHPGHPGERILGEDVVASLAAIPDPGSVDMVDIFRRSADVPPVVADALAHLPNLTTVWMQMGISNAPAAAAARAKDVDVIEDRCPMVDFPRLRLGPRT